MKYNSVALLLAILTAGCVSTPVKPQPPAAELSVTTSLQSGILTYNINNDLSVFAFGIHLKPLTKWRLQTVEAPDAMLASNDKLGRLSIVGAYSTPHTTRLILKFVGEGTDIPALELDPAKKSLLNEDLPVTIKQEL